MWAERRDLPVVEVLEAVSVFAQPELLVTSDEEVGSIPFYSSATPDTSTIISPFPQVFSSPSR